MIWIFRLVPPWLTVPWPRLTVIREKANRECISVRFSITILPRVFHTTVTSGIVIGHPVVNRKASRRIHVFRLVPWLSFPTWESTLWYLNDINSLGDNTRSLYPFDQTTPYPFNLGDYIPVHYIFGKKMDLKWDEILFILGIKSVYRPGWARSMLV